jgi:hypothetical protein
VLRSPSIHSGAFFNWSAVYEILKAPFSGSHVKIVHRDGYAMATYSQHSTGRDNEPVNGLRDAF